MENVLDEVMTLNEAAKKWGKDDSTLRKKIKSAQLIEGKDYRKSGDVWLIRKEAMERVYGNEKSSIARKSVIEAITSMKPAPYNEVNDRLLEMSRKTKERLTKNREKE